MLLALSHRLQHTGGAAHAAVHILAGAADTVVPTTARGDVHAQQRRTLQTGLVGMPNVGKSTLFNAMLGRAAAEASNFPFCKPLFPSHCVAVNLRARCKWIVICIMVTTSPPLPPPRFILKRRHYRPKLRLCTRPRRDIEGTRSDVQVCTRRSDISGFCRHCRSHQRC